MCAALPAPAHFPGSLQGTPGRSFWSKLSRSLLRKPHPLESLPACVWRPGPGLGQESPPAPSSPHGASWPDRLLHRRAVTHLTPLFFLFLPLLLFLCRLFPRAHPKPPNTIRTEGVRGRDERKGLTGSGDERLLPEPAVCPGPLAGGALRAVHSASALVKTGLWG